MKWVNAPLLYTNLTLREIFIVIVINNNKKFPILYIVLTIFSHNIQKYHNALLRTKYTKFQS